MPKTVKKSTNVIHSAMRLAFIQVTCCLCPLLFMPNQAWANDTKTPNPCQPERIIKAHSIPAQTPNQPVTTQHIEADKLSQPNPSQYLLQGNATLSQPGMVVISDKARYDKSDKTAAFNGNIKLHQPEMLMRAESATLDNTQNKAELNQTEYQLLPSLTHGKSKHIEIDKQAQQAKLAQATLSTCKKNADKSVDWNLKFDTLTINNQTRRVIGKNTTLYFKDIPIFYTPYFDYPLDERASGLLFPEIGSYKALTQSSPNQYIKQPYYFNIAPNIDDTLTAIPMTQRGLALENEFRYTSQHNAITHSAEFTLTGLNDQLTASEGLVSSDASGNLIYGDKQAERWRASIQANQNWGNGFTSTLNWDEVSDQNFFADIPVQKELKTATQKQRNASINYQNNGFNAYLQLVSYLRLQNAAINYEKRPEIGLNYSQYLDDFDFDITATTTDFVVPVSGHNKAEALRFHTAPSLSYQLQESYGYVKTTVVANQTLYNMKDNGFNPSSKSTLSRSIPQFAMRGGLTFERNFTLAGSNYIQTLEPEIQYLYTPYQNQSDIALFDTAQRSLDFSNLFALNRFTGADRIGDTSQMSTALSSKILSADGQPIAEAAIGQIAYFSDRKVTLSGTPDTQKVSDIFMKLGFNSNDWYLSTTVQLDHNNLTLTNANSRIKWQEAQNLLLLNHTLNNNGTSSETEMLSLGAYTQVNSTWDLGLYSSYDMKKQALYETQLGLRYDSCCWAVEFVAERTQLENDLYNDGIQIQFELKGLSTSSSRFKQNLSNKLNF